MDFHPISGAFPLMEGEEFRELVEDIAKNGQQQPILTHEGKILDGRNRYRACVEAGVEPWVERWYGDSPVEAVLSLNVHRRHLSSSQKSAAAAELIPHMKAEAKRRQRNHGGTAPGKHSGNKFPQVENRVPVRASEEAAKAVGGTNRKYVEKANRLRAEDPETFEKVKRGEVQLSPLVNPKKPKAAPRRGRSQEPTAAELGQLAGDDFTPPPRELSAEQNNFYDTPKHILKLQKLNPEVQAAEWLEVKDDGVSIGPHIRDAAYAKEWYAKLEAALEKLDRQNRRETGNLRVVGGEE